MTVHYTLQGWDLVSHTGRTQIHLYTDGYDTTPLSSSYCVNTQELICQQLRLNLQNDDMGFFKINTEIISNTC